MGKDVEIIQPSPLEMANLEKQHRQALRQTEKAVCDFPDHYRKIKKTVNHILTHPIDVGEYYDVSLKLAGMVQDLGTDTIFYPYFFENIHPNMKGRAKYFRSVCRDLKTQLMEFNDSRKKQRHIRLVK